MYKLLGTTYIMYKKSCSSSRRLTYCTYCKMKRKCVPIQARKSFFLIFSRWDLNARSWMFCSYSPHQRLLHRSNSCNTVFFSYIYLGKEYETAVIRIRTMAGQTVPQIIFQYIYTYTSLLDVIWAYKSLRWKSTVLKTLHDHNSCSTRIVEITCRVTTKGITRIILKTH